MTARVQDRLVDVDAVQAPAARSSGWATAWRFCAARNLPLGILRAGPSRPGRDPVEYYEVDVVAERPALPLDPVGGDVDAIPLGRQTALDEIRDPRFVLDDEDPQAVHARCTRARCARRLPQARSRRHVLRTIEAWR